MRSSSRAFLRVISIASFRFTGCWSSFNPFLLRRPPIVKSLPFLILQFTWNELLQYSWAVDFKLKCSRTTPFVRGAIVPEGDPSSPPSPSGP